MKAGQEKYTCKYEGEKKTFQNYIGMERNFFPM